MAEVSIGSVFAGYRIEGLAAEGGMGRLYRATQIALKRQVALKLILPQLADDEGFRARFERESYLAASIDHPNVIPIYEAGQADGRLFIAMRWVEGTDLRTVIADEGRIEAPRLVGIVEQVAAALDAAHGGGLVHRDVKPANVMLTAAHGQEHAYLTDFGLVKKTLSDTALTRTGMFIGTPDYMPPEQIRGEQADARADVYALGCLLFHALTGRTPFGRDSELATMYAHLHDAPPRVVETVPGAPAGLDMVITRALAKDAAQRYPSAGDLGRAARAALSGTPPSQPERSLATGIAAPQTTEAAAPTAPGAPPTAPGTPATMPGAAPTAPGTPATVPAAASTAPGQAPVPPAPTFIPPTTGKSAGSADLPPVSAGKRPRRSALPVAGAALVALVAAGGVLAATGVFSGDGGTGSTPAPRAPKVAATIPAGNGPDGIDVDGSTVWVSNAEANTLTRLDTETNKRIGEPVAVGRNPDNVVAADGVVWVANTDDGSVSRLSGDRATVKTVPVGGGPEGLSLKDQVLWVANGDSDSVSRLDRASATAAGAPIGVGNRPIGIFAGKDYVWVTNSFSRTVTRIDASSARVVGRPVPVGKNTRSVIEGLGATWVSSVDEDTVTRLDPTSGKVLGTPIPVGDRPKEMAVAGGLLWVVNEGSDSVSRIDPKSGKVVGAPIRVGSTPVGIAAGAGSLWVTNNASDTVTRIDP